MRSRGLAKQNALVSEELAYRNSRSLRERFVRRLKKDHMLYLLCVPALLLVLVFKYFPMYGAIIAFKRFNMRDGFWGSPWVGLHWFVRFFTGPYFWRTTRNTLVLGFWSLVVGFPAPIILALLMNEVRWRVFKRVTQTISYMPHFLSTVVIVGILKELTDPINGPVNELLKHLGGEPINFFVRPEWFRFLYVSSGVWQGMGFGSIIYLAALAGVDVQLYEAAIVDGAGRWRQMWNITLPSITPTIVILFILNIGSLVSTDFTKVLLMYNSATFETADVIGTYVYRLGIESGGGYSGGNVSYATAVGLFLSVVSFLLLYVTNRISKATSEYYLW